MRLRYKDIKKIAWMCAAMLFLIGVHLASVYVFAVHRFTVSYDAALSENAQSAVEEYIRISRLYESASPEQITQELQSKFPFIHQVTCSYAPSGLHLNIKSYRPFVQLATGHVVTANNYCFPKDYFIRSKSIGLPILHAALAQREQLPADMFAYLQSIEKDLLKGAVIRWNHVNEITCEIAGQPMQLVCNYQKKPTRAVLESCRVIAQDLKKQPLLAKGFCADMRFDDRIVVAKLRKMGA